MVRESTSITTWATVRFRFVSTYKKEKATQNEAMSARALHADGRPILKAFLVVHKRMENNTKY